MKKLLVAALLLPLGVLAQPGPAQNPGQNPGQGQGRVQRLKDDPKFQEKLQRRAKLARTLGLAEALDLDAKKALELDAQMSRFDERRTAIRKQMRDAHDVLRKAAAGEKVSAAEVDQAIQRGFEARTQMAQVDREAAQSILKDLTPEQRARAVLFLDRFQRRFSVGGPGARDVRVFKRRGGPGEGPGAGAMMGRGPGAMAFSFNGGPVERKRVVIAGPDGTRVFDGDEADAFVSHDFAFDDQFDVEVEVEEE